MNAADNFQRDKGMTSIKVDIDPETNTISVWNDGQGIDVRIDTKEKVWIPDLIFGHLLTSSNYDDNEKKVTGGRNGYGAKLCNIYSTKFIVETMDSYRKKSYKQIFSNNMTKRNDPIVKDAKRGKDFVKITFQPDLERFKMDSLSTDVVALMKKRVYDIAGCNSSLKVFLNGTKIPVNSFKQYVELYTKADPTLKVVQETVSDRWSIAVAMADGDFRQCSFVNSIATIRGGSHVEHVAKPIVNAVIEAIKKKDKKGTAVKPAQVKAHMWIFVNSLIENPAFDSQTKETLTTKVGQFGSSCKPSETFLKKVLKDTGIVEATTRFAAFKAEKSLGRKDGKKKSRLTGIPKLDDANKAGTASSNQCTLIVTEGDSAKTLAVSGLGVVGRDFYGVFPLRGKLLNVRDASAKQLMDNAEINNIKQILGLKQNVTYKDPKTFNSLRYGHLMIMTDQDHDGSHIKGLLINMFATFWKELLQKPGFLVEFITPIVKVSKKGKQDIPFYTLTEYLSWKEAHNDGKGWSIKYYKGLGTSSREEARDYFRNLNRHKINFSYEGVEDLDSLELAFSKKLADKRKQWMTDFDRDTFLDQNVDEISYSDFVNKELIHFSISDCLRSIPSVVDGLKPGQRKILFSCFKRDLKKDIKVAQLSGYVSEKSAYHHGEASLQSTIINMAQNFVGSNNVNLLHPSGQFGSRLQGGKDSASPRYIFTRLAKMTRCLFPETDDKILKYLDDDGLSIEPEWYIPVLPMVLVNGADGIGTGWSTSVPKFNPLDLIENIKHVIAGDPLDELVPWYSGFTGSFHKDPKKEGTFICRGVYELDESCNEVRITELPVGTWTQNYKEFLESNLIDTGSNTAFITDIKEYHAEMTIDFKIVVTDKGMEGIKADPYKKLKLACNINTSNMHLFNEKGRITKYKTPNDILLEFCQVRKTFYRKRKDFLQDQLQNELEKLSNQARFILAVIKDEVKIRNVARKKVIKQLEEQNYQKFIKGQAKKVKTEDDLEADDDGEEDESGEGKNCGYEYLLSMNLWSLTEEKVKKLLAQRDAKQDELDVLLGKSPEDLWGEDLTAVEQEYTQFVAALEAEMSDGGKKGQKKRVIRKPKYESSDDEFEVPTRGRKPAVKKAPAKTATTKAATARATKAAAAKTTTTKAAAAKTTTTKTTTVKKEPAKAAPAKAPAKTPAKGKGGGGGGSAAKSSLLTKYFPKEDSDSDKEMDYSDFNDFLSEGESEEDFETPKKTRKKKVILDSEDEDEDMLASKKKTPPRASKGGAKKYQITSDSEEEEDLFEEPPARKKAAAKPAAKTAPKTAAKTTTTKAKPAAKTAAAPASRKRPAASKPATAKAPPKKKTTKKQVYSSEEDEDEDSFSDVSDLSESDEDDFVPVKRGSNFFFFSFLFLSFFFLSFFPLLTSFLTAAPSRRTAAKKKATYNFSSEEESEEDDDESDFEA